MLMGKGYSVGPGYEVQGTMVFDIIDKEDTLVLLIREDKSYDIDKNTRRRENAVNVSKSDFNKLGI